MQEKDTSIHYNSPSGHQTQFQDELATIPEEEEEEQEVEEQPDPADQDTLVFDSEESEEELFNTAVDTTSDDSAITMGKPVTTAFISNQVQIPTETYWFAMYQHISNVHSGSHDPVASHSQHKKSPQK